MIRYAVDPLLVTSSCVIAAKRSGPPDNKLVVSVSSLMSPGIEPLKLTVTASPDTAVVISVPPVIVNISVVVLAVVDPLSPSKVTNTF